jgi:hypothetical protein
METKTIYEILNAARLRAADILDSNGGALLARGALIAAWLAVYYHPSSDQALAFIQRLFVRAAPVFLFCGFVILIAPFFGVLIALGTNLAMLIVKQVDVLMFDWPRRLVRRRLGALAAFALAFAFELTVLTAAGVYLARSFKRDGPVIVGTGVSQERLLEIRRRYRLK